VVTISLTTTGRKKRDIVEMALEICGLAGFEFEHTPEEISSTLRILDTMMAEHPWNLTGYNAATYGAGLPEDLSGLAEIDVSAVVHHLALRRAPGLGASLSPEAKASITRSYGDLTARYASIVTMPLGPNTVRGSGKRRFEPFINETT
jgi:hypothetical protein